LLPQGRWPANLILDEHAAALLDAQSGELKPATSRTSAGVESIERALFGGGQAGPLYPDTGGASRFFYTAKASRRERTCEGTVENVHPTVKPLSLMRWLCRLTKTPTGGVVLDPFLGSGTTGMAAVLEGREFVGIELERESFEIAKARIAWAKEQVPEMTQAQMAL
jgi:site-specific DNA-methyltransferase (adenine-specific)